jgi:hypothetical protein
MAVAIPPAMSAARTTTRSRLGASGTAPEYAFEPGSEEIYDCRMALASSVSPPGV